MPFNKMENGNSMEVDADKAINSIPLELLPCSFSFGQSNLHQQNPGGKFTASATGTSDTGTFQEEEEGQSSSSSCGCAAVSCSSSSIGGGGDNSTCCKLCVKLSEPQDPMEIDLGLSASGTKESTNLLRPSSSTDTKGDGDGLGKAPPENCTMIAAATKGDVSLLRSVVCNTISQGHIPLKEWSYSLLLAVNRRNTAMVDYLLSLEGITADISLFNCWYPIPLIAIDLNDIAMVEVLLKHSASFREVGPQGGALHCAARVGNVEIMRKILDAEGEQLNINAKNKGDEMTPLHVAVQRDNWACARLLIERGCEVEEKEYSKGRSALHYAAMKGHLDTVNLLLEQGANPSWYDADHYVPWMLAAVNDHTQVMVPLMPNSDVNALLNNNMMLLHLAAKTGNLKCMRLLLSMGANVNAVDVEGNTPLYYAASHKHVQACKLLCRRPECNVNKANIFHETPLHAALEFSMDASALLTLNVLKAAGANLDIRDRNQFTPLMTYIYSHEMAQWLLEAGADPNVVTDDGHSVFFEAVKVAVSENSEKTLWLLLRSNVDISTTRHVVSETKLTPLQHVLKQRADKIASFMLNIGCSLQGMRQWLKTHEAGELQTYSAMAPIMTRLQKKVDQEPFSLQMLSRSAVLGCLGHKQLQKEIAKLDIPDLLKGYLNWDTFVEWSRFEDSKMLNDFSHSGEP